MEISNLASDPPKFVGRFAACRWRDLTLMTGACGPARMALPGDEGKTGSSCTLASGRCCGSKRLAGHRSRWVNDKDNPWPRRARDVDARDLMRDPANLLATAYEYAKLETLAEGMR